MIVDQEHRCHVHNPRLRAAPSHFEPTFWKGLSGAGSCVVCWCPGSLAVARGAAYYGLARRGMGRKIGGGGAHAFYVGLDTKGDEGAKQLPEQGGASAAKPTVAAKEHP